MKTKKTPKIEPDYRLYILMRNDLPSLNAGKAMAQAAHAANAFTAEWGHFTDVQDYSNKNHPFGTAICLAVNKATLIERLRRAQERDKTVVFGSVWDETYPFSTTSEIASLIPKSKLTAKPVITQDGRAFLCRKEITCGYLFLLNGSQEQAALVSDLPLYP